jgi:protein-S-isoprenylcysteine O-methyltransferase Ste14
LKDISKNEKRSRNWLVTLIFVIFGGPGIIVVYLPAWITRWRITPDPWLVLLAIPLFAFGLTPLTESIVRFVRVGLGTLSPTHPTEHLVISGSYRYVRNPMYIGVLALIAGQAALFGSRDLVEYWALVAIGFHLFVVLYEEPTLRKKYGAEYEEFCRAIPRWIPR